MACGGWAPSAGGERACDVNDATQVVGLSRKADGNEHAFLWTAGAGHGGSRHPRRREERGRRNQRDRGSGREQRDGGRAPRKRSCGPGRPACGAWENPRSAEDLFATGINTHRRVVGITFSGGEIEDLPFLWTSGSGIQLLPTLGGPLGQAQDLNEFGQIVGTTRTSLNDIRATLWTPIDGPLAVAPGRRSR